MSKWAISICLFLLVVIVAILVCPKLENHQPEAFAVGSIQIGNDVMAEAVGIEIIGGVFAPILESGQPIPATETVTFSTVEDLQEQIKLKLFAGSNSLVQDNTLLGHLEITDFKLSDRGEPQIALKIEVSDQGAVFVSASESGRPLKVSSKVSSH